MTDPGAPEPQAKPRWQPISSIERRVAGVLVEKAKTTPEQYPLSLNALKVGCNQKNNRDPVLELEQEAVEAAVDKLRELGAAVVVQGGGRVSKYRHCLYEWFGVDKVELAVMTELLLRGPQTEGELRGRAARMEPIADLAALRPVLASLKTKGLVVPLTPEGRGHVVTHALYPPREWERIQAKFAGYVPPGGGGDDEEETTWASAPQWHGPATAPPAPHAAATGPPRSVASEASSGPVFEEKLAELREEFEREIGTLRSEVAELKSTVAQLRDESDRLRRELGVV
ncbi:MAG: YceH family protein [Pirellulales bacterium]|nr:YceH family protein [Pirellulales bacterium]